MADKSEVVSVKIPKHIYMKIKENISDSKFSSVDEYIIAKLEDAGLPRSGTSMMMKMLEAGGMSILTDNIRVADEDNLKGYYEFERVKKLEEDKEWLDDAKGKVVKVISYLLKYLPDTHKFKIIFMQREIFEVLASQRKMMERRGEKEDNIPEEKMAEQFKSHLDQIYQWIKDQNNIDILFVNYNDTLKSSMNTAVLVSEFLDVELDLEKMANVVDNTLYRQRV